MADIATKELSNHLNVPVRIGEVDIEWFNRLVLYDLYLEDEKGEVLFEADHVSAGLEITPLFEGKLVFSAIRLFGFTFNLNKETPKDKLNLQFVIDAFAKKDTVKKELNVDLRFNTILLKRGHFKYDVASLPHTPDKFNANHIHIKNLNAKISLDALNKDSLHAEIKKMNFEEASGFTLNKLTLEINATRDSAILHNLEMKLPQTNLNIDRAHILKAKVDSLPNLFNQSPIYLDIDPSQVYLKDLSAFVPAFKNFDETLELTAVLSGYVNDITLNQLTLKHSDRMLFIGRMNLKDISDTEKAHITGEVNKLYITTEGISGLANNFSDKPLPQAVRELGTVNFSGKISGHFDHLVAQGKLSTSIGSVQTNVTFGKNKKKNIKAFLKGHISTSPLQLHELLPEGNPLGTTQLQISIDAKRPEKGPFVGNIQANIEEFHFKKYKYQDILISGNFQEKSFEGLLQINDPNGKFSAQGLFLKDGENSKFNFISRLENLRPDNLHLTDKYESPVISGVLNANFTGNNIDNIVGEIQLDSLAFHTAPDSFFLKQLKIEASHDSFNQYLKIKSDIMNGEVSGAYSFATIVPSFMNTLEQYIPALIHTTQKKQQTKENNFSLLLTIENTETLSNTLKLPITLFSQGRITGHYNNQYNRFRLETYLPQFKIGKTFLESGYVVCDNPFDKINLELKATQFNKKGLRNYLNLKVDAKDNIVNTWINWANNKERLFKADLSASTLFVEEPQETGKPKLRTEITINECPLILNDSLWHIAPATITIANKKIDINDFSITNGDKQHLYLDGLISKNPTDTLLLDLKQIELKYIFDILNIPALQFGGKATGTFNITDLYGSRILNTDLEILDFSFNQVDLGKLNLYSEWDDEEKGILMLGTIYKNDSTWTDVNGYIYPIGKDAGLSLHFDANDINVAILQPFLQEIGNNLQGRGSGEIHLHGPFTHLNVEGDAYVKNGGLGIDFLNTYYTFSDSIHLSKYAIKANKVTVYDKFGNSALLDLKVNHEHFKDASYDIGIQANNMLVYDVTQKQNPLIYGTVYGTGSATIKGNEQLINFDINMQSAPKTSIQLDFMNSSSAIEYDFITFVDKNKLDEQSPTESTESLKPVVFNDNAEKAEMRMNFLLDITPNAKIELIMDPVAGDRIAGNCSGSLQIQYGTHTDLRMYGNVGITKGNYNFSLQQLIHKNFKIREGSTINFHGDPFEATMNIDAIYNVTANIQDLDASFAYESARRNIPVNCVLNLDGVLHNPTISFDLELPGSNEELERQVKSIVNSEDMMTRQIIYLLVLNKFYTPEYSNNQYKSNDFSAVASSALSSQISSLMNSFTDKVQLGTNIRTSQDGIQDTEVEMLLSSQLLNNRLIFNGNFGYKNNATQKNAFIGEFDLEYLLTPNGEIRLKAYNHANDMYMFLKQALTTQGIGIALKKDFTHFSEIFRRKKKYTLTQTQPSLLDSTHLSSPKSK